MSTLASFAFGVVVGVAAVLALIAVAVALGIHRACKWAGNQSSAREQVASAMRVISRSTRRES